jgi:hypothetical protein
MFSQDSKILELLAKDFIVHWWIKINRGFFSNNLQVEFLILLVPLFDGEISRSIFGVDAG